MKSDKTMKRFAKEAKSRMKSGFWENRIEEWQSIREKSTQSEVAAENKIANKKDELVRMFYSREAYEEEESFYRAVCEIVEANPPISNPIMVLCRREGIDKLPDGVRTGKILELSARYGKMLERYEREHRLSR